MRSETEIKTYNSFNDYYLDANAPVRSSHDEFHLFRFSELGDSIVQRMGPFTTAYFQFAIGSEVQAKVGVFDTKAVTEKLSHEESKWSLETSLTAPIARIYMLKAGYRMSQASELGFGIGYQNWRNRDVDPAGQSNAWSVIVSYRHYLYRTISFEVELWPAYNHFESFLDGQIYKGFELWVEYRIGYRFDLTSTLSINVMPGLGHPIWAQHDWPRLVEKSRESPFDLVVFIPQALIGWRF